MSRLRCERGTTLLQKIVLLLLLSSCVQKPGSEVPAGKEAAQEETSDIPSASIKNNCSDANETSTLGIGLMLAPPHFTLFHDSLLRDKFADIEIYTDEQGSSQICPKFFDRDYGIVHFVCVDSTATAYKVLADSSSVAFMDINSGGKFTTWENYILTSFGIRRVTENEGAAPVQNDLKASPSDKSKALSIPEGFEMFCPMEIRDDWVKVRYDCFYNADNNPHEGEPCYNFIDECKDPLTGWLKWRSGNKILVDIFLMP